MRIGKRICFFIAIGVMAPCMIARSAYCQAQNASWVDCFGFWSNGSNWSGGVAPNNTSTTTYNVTINPAASQCAPDSGADVNLDQDVTINSLTLGFNNFLLAGLNTPGHTLTILSGFDNEGGIEFFSASTLVIDGLFVNSNEQGVAADDVDFEDGGRLVSHGFTNNGSFRVGPGSEIDARGGAFTNLDSSTGTLNGTVLNRNVVFDIAGTFRFDAGPGIDGGNIINIGPNVILDLEGGQMLYGPGAGTNALAHLGSNAGFFEFTGNLSVGAGFSNSGVLAIGSFSSGGSMTVNGNFTNSGTVCVGSRAGGSCPTFPQAGSFGPSSTLTVSSGSSYTQSSLGTTIINGGTLTASTIDIQGGLSLAGTIDGNLTIEANGHDTGQGTINGNLTNLGTFARTGIVTGDVLNAGLLAEGAKVGALTIGGNYTQTNTGTLSEMLSSPSSFDRVDVSGLAFIGGTLAITTHFNPFGGETLTILDSSSLSGQFSDIVGDHFGGPNDFWSVVYTPTSVELVANTPEPGTLVLLGIGVLGLAGFTRRRALPARQIEI